MTIDVEKYRNILVEIMKRTEVIREHLMGNEQQKYLVTEVEFLCLQFRKILELIALSSLVANKEEYAKQQAKFASHYNARVILQDLERVNPDFYPVPTQQVLAEVNGQQGFRLEPVTEGFLTRDEFVKVYEKCGGMLHAENPYGHKRDFEAVMSEIPTWLGKVVILLNHHNIALVDGETMIVGLMRAGDQGLPQVSEFKRVKER